jgi:hypothetical protein
LVVAFALVVAFLVVIPERDLLLSLHFLPVIPEGDLLFAFLFCHSPAAPSLHRKRTSLNGFSMSHNSSFGT